MVTFEEAFEQTGYGVFNHLVLVACGLVLMYTNIETLGVGYIISPASCDMSLTGSQAGMVNAAAFIGIVTMSIIWGYMSDRFGRRSVMIPTIAASSLVSFMSSFALNFVVLFSMRFLVGCLLSASSATVYAYLGEMHSDSKRASAITFGSTFISFTFILLPALAWIIMPGIWPFSVFKVTMVPWRVFVWSWCLPGVTAVIILLFLPESPRYLLSEKGQVQAVTAMAKIYAWNHRKKMEDFPVQSITGDGGGTGRRGFIKSFSNIWLLFKQPLLKCVLISHYSMFIVFMEASGFYTWMPVIINEMLFNEASSSNLCAVMMAKNTKENQEESSISQDAVACKLKTIHHLLYPVTICMGVVCAVIYIAIGFLTRKYSKTKIYCSLVASTSLVLVASSVVPNLNVALSLFILGICSGTAASLLAAIAVEVFPTNVRALALCTLYMSGRMGAAVGSGFLGICMREYCVPAFLTVTVLTMVSTFLMLLWPDPKVVRQLMEEKGFLY